jgi:excinuclease UvrABC nuclease subunit
VRVTIGRSPKVGAARVPKDDGNLYLGPFSSMRTVRTLLDGLRDAARIHRCTEPRRCNGCPYSDLGTCAGPERQRDELRVIAAAVAGDPAPALRAVATRMHRLAATERYEEAAEVRARGELLESSLHKNTDAIALRDAGDVVLAVGTRALLIRDARLVAAVDLGHDEDSAIERLRAAAPEGSRGRFLTAAQQREARVLNAWLKRTSEPVRILYAQKPWVLPVASAPTALFTVKK